MTCALYRMKDAGGDLLYIGVSDHVLRRFHEHSRQKWWWVQVAAIDVMHYETRNLALMAEQAAIRTETPRYNVEYNESREHWVFATARDVPFQPPITLDAEDGPILLDDDDSPITLD